MAVQKGKKGNTNASRAAKNKEMRQEALRDQLAAQNLLSRIEKDLEALDKVRQAVKRGKRLDRFDTARIEIQTLKTRLDVYFKKLNKLLPDLKSQDIKGEMENFHYHPTPEDRQYAALHGMSLNEYMQRKAEDNLPEPPEVPGAPNVH